MWKITILMDQADKPKLTDLGSVLDRASSVSIEAVEDSARAIQSNKYRHDETFSETVARTQGAFGVPEMDSSVPASLAAQLDRVEDKAHAQGERSFVFSSELSEAQEEGGDAYADGGDLSDNPYTPETERWRIWRTGFLDGSTRDSDADDHLC